MHICIQYSTTMMQFESSDFVLYLFCVMLYKQSEWSAIGSRELNGIPNISNFFLIRARYNWENISFGPRRGLLLN